MLLHSPITENWHGAADPSLALPPVLTRKLIFMVLENYDLSAYRIHLRSALVKHYPVK
jgi:hypothetical protein